MPKLASLYLDEHVLPREQLDSAFHLRDPFSQGSLLLPLTFRLNVQWQTNVPPVKLAELLLQLQKGFRPLLVRHQPVPVRDLDGNSQLRTGPLDTARLALFQLDH